MCENTPLCQHVSMCFEQSDAECVYLNEGLKWATRALNNNQVSEEEIKVQRNPC